MKETLMLNSAVLEVTMPKSNHRRLWIELFEDLCSRSVMSGEEAMMLIVNKIGGVKSAAPDHDDLYIIGRNRTIRRQRHKGASTASLMVEWNLSRPQLWRILNEEE